MQDPLVSHSALINKGLFLTVDILFQDVPSSSTKNFSSTEICKKEGSL